MKPEKILKLIMCCHLPKLGGSYLTRFYSSYLVQDGIQKNFHLQPTLGWKKPCWLLLQRFLNGGRNKLTRSSTSKRTEAWIKKSFPEIRNDKLQRIKNNSAKTTTAANAASCSAVSSSNHWGPSSPGGRKCSSVGWLSEAAAAKSPSKATFRGLCTSRGASTTTTKWPPPCRRRRTAATSTTFATPTPPSSFSASATSRWTGECSLLRRCRRRRCRRGRRRRRRCCRRSTVTQASADTGLASEDSWSRKPQQGPTVSGASREGKALGRGRGGSCSGWWGRWRRSKSASASGSAAASPAAPARAWTARSRRSGAVGEKPKS